MWELYLLTRLDNIVSFFIVVLLFSFVLIAIALALYITDKTDHCIKPLALIGGIPMIISTIGLLITPTTNDGMLILGIGKSIDYLKSNETNKQLPDKCINALNVWVDSFTEENKRKKSN